MLQLIACLFGLSNSMTTVLQNCKLEKMIAEYKVLKDIHDTFNQAKGNGVPPSKGLASKFSSTNTLYIKISTTLQYLTSQVQDGM